MSATLAPAVEPVAPAGETLENEAPAEVAAATQTAIETPANEWSEEAAASPPAEAVPAPDSAKKAGEAAALVRARATLPPALRERLAALVESRGDVTAGGQPRLPLDVYLKALEETLPEFLQARPADAHEPRHPGGEGYFRGSTELSDAEAEALAQQQLSRSGLLRGQRVRVGD